jgi:DHA2 family multidrug resistance protein-like MFS transporter
MQSNAAVRQAGTVAFMFNLILALIAIISITVTIPKGRKYHD